MIPIYRAEKLDSDEWAEGYLSCDRFLECYLIDTGEEFNEDIDPNTLAIHFPNMIDKNGKKIFASLSEDGVGGDDLTWGEIEMTARYSQEDGAFILIGDGAGFMNPEYCVNFEVIGIHK